MLWLTKITVRPSAGDFIDFAQAFLLEFGVADRQNFIDNQNFWLEMAATAKASRTYIPLRSASPAYP